MAEARIWVGEHQARLRAGSGGHRAHDRRRRCPLDGSEPIDVALKGVAAPMRVQSVRRSAEAG